MSLLPNEYLRNALLFSNQQETWDKHLLCRNILERSIRAAEGEQIEKLQGTKEALATNMWEKEQLQQDRNITALRQQHNTG